jgi:polar amino acid transport system substrate-binding protein
MKPWLMATIVIVVVVALVAVVVLGGFLNGASADALEKIKKRGTLIVGTNVPYPPFETFNATSGKYEGVDMDIITEIADRMGVKVEFKPMDFDALIGAVQAGQIDVAISSFTITEERAKSIDFSHAYSFANQTVLVHDDSTIASIDDLENKTFTAQTGTTGAYWIEDNIVALGKTSEANYTAQNDMYTSIMLVQNKQAQVCVLDSPIGTKYATAENFNLKIAFTIPTNEQYGIVCPKGQTALLNAVNAALDGMKTDGTLAEIMSNWL